MFYYPDSTWGPTSRRPFLGVKMSLIQEFKAFAARGNVIDMAVGIIIGAAFGKIVSSFVGDVIMPPIGLILGGWISAISPSP